MIKKLNKVVYATVICIGLFSFNVFAAPEKLSANIKPTAELLNVLKPENNISTYSDTSIISCIAKPGSTVTVYVQSLEDEEVYIPLVVDKEIVSAKVGPSGMFMAEIPLDRDIINKILVFAEKSDKDYDLAKREITVKNQTTKEKLKNITVKIEDFIGNLFNK